MGRKVFVSYKYADSKVEDLDVYEDREVFGMLTKVKVTTTARHYVDKLSEELEKDDEIYKGEDDDESMESLADSTIASKLGDKIFDSSVTVVLVSKGMKEALSSENEQWIPWEISYSLKEQSRKNVRSKTNGVIAVVLPDETGSYEYYITRDEECNCRTLKTDFLFQILRDNMFNVKEPNKRPCNGSDVYSGDCSYIQSVKWVDFIKNISKYNDKAIELRDKIGDFNPTKTIK
ncbi:TIR domain-containing protein [Labilibaculum sp.]|uniref:TIR domain-containing protein n=1 Tax=Labilibaculum sp. TaxID=2060723 RepID=UPI002AA8B6FD|nr:TIR domain-containing protein [Labilibaculum sp.]